MTNQYNVLIDIVGALLVSAIFLAELRQRRHGDVFTTNLLNLLMLCCVLVFLMDIPGLLLDGKTFSGVRPLLWLFDSAYWALQAGYCWLWLIFADYWAFGSKSRLKKLRAVYILPLALEVVLVAVNPFTGWIFTIDNLNVYIRGRFYLLNMLPYVFYILAALGITIYASLRSDSPERRRRVFSLAFYMFLPICSVFFEAFVYGISWVWPMVALSLLMVYLNVQQQIISEEQLAAAKLETELFDSRVAIMLSQIQPHFLYNSLTAISQLCEKDPKRAKTAIIDFSAYLRANLDSLKQREPVPVSTELLHLKTYLELEQMRFGDELRVVFDLQANGFRVPSLTIQPLVENAVKHGVGDKEDGGTVTIATSETADAYLVTISDDGVGFDQSVQKRDGRAHIGIDNVKSRLDAQCGGRLEIQSAPGKGTTATIIIPKEAETL